MGVLGQQACQSLWLVGAVACIRPGLMGVLGQQAILGGGDSTSRLTSSPSVWRSCPAHVQAHPGGIYNQVAGVAYSRVCVRVRTC